MMQLLSIYKPMTTNNIVYSDLSLVLFYAYLQYDSVFY